MKQNYLAGNDTLSKTPNLGFLGVGWIGRNRMEAILNAECARVSLIAEPVEENARQALKLAKNAALASDFDEIVNNPDIDGIVIATPSAMHARQAIKALEQGKAVFCQKPLGRNAEEAKEVVKAAKEAGKLLAVDLSYRYTQAAQSIYPLIRDNILGKIFAVELIFHNAYGPDKPWFYDINKSGGGCVIDLGIHLVDMALWCLNFPDIISVHSSLYSKGNKLMGKSKEAEDFACASLETAEGTTINLQCSWNMPIGQDAAISVAFLGTKGGTAFKNVNGSFYDFIAEKYDGTHRELLASPPDNWGGRAGVIWAKRLSHNPEFDEEAGDEYIKTAEILDKIYGR